MLLLRRLVDCTNAGQVKSNDLGCLPDTVISLTAICSRLVSILRSARSCTNSCIAYAPVKTVLSVALCLLLCSSGVWIYLAVMVSEACNTTDLRR